MSTLNTILPYQFGNRSELGESPCWDADYGAFWWVDVTGQKLLRMDSQSGAMETWNTPEQIGFVVLRAPGRPVVGMQTGIFAFDPQSGSFEQMIEFTRPGQRFNDAMVDPFGRFWVSTMDLDSRPGCGEIYYVTESLTLKSVVRGLTIPNGLALDTARERLYYSDSYVDSQTIWKCHIGAGSTDLGEADEFASTTALAGRPDGASVDVDGNYWIAGVDGSEVYVFRPDGTLQSALSVPFPAPTKLIFFGTDGRSVIVTSKGIGPQGGYLAIGAVPDGMAAGTIQPHWRV